jgi:hypothetical protein
MALNQGRLGTVGFALQASFGTPVTTPDVYLTFNSMTLEEKHEVIPVQGAVSHRMNNVSSVLGKKWGEGDLEVDMDVVKAGYIVKWALGNEIYTAGTPSQHLFYTTVSGNTPKLATITYEREGADIVRFSDVAVNTMTLNITDGIATLAANVRGRYPVAGADLTPTTVSGTVITFGNMALQFGADLATADAAAATPVQEFQLEVNNNLEVIHSTQATQGTTSYDVSNIRTKNLEITGSYKLFFDGTTDMAAYSALTKRSMIATFQSSPNEVIEVKIAKFRVDEKTVETGVDDLFMITANFVAELDTSQVPNDLSVLIKNTKSSVY